MLVVGAAEDRLILSMTARLTLQDDDGNTLGTFTANQQGNTTITIPTSDFSGSWNDLTDKPTIGDGKITIEENNGNDLGEFTVNQVGNLIITLPAGASFSGSYDDLTNKPDHWRRQTDHQQQ